MPTYVVSGSAFPDPVAGGVSAVDDAVAGEEGVAVESAVSQDDGSVQFTLHVSAPDEQTATSTAQRVADTLSRGSSVTVVDRID